MLDSKRAKGTIKLGVNPAAGMVMKHKQGLLFHFKVLVHLILEVKSFNHIKI